MQHDTAERPFRHRAPRPTSPMRPEDCPVQATLDVLDGRWKPLVLWHLRPGMRRFNELRRLVPGVTQRMLATTLRELERDGLVRREIFAEVPPRVEYTLTPLAGTLYPILDAMAAWGAARGEEASAR